MYTKIFSQILDSSIVESPELRFTFMDMLVLADPDGVVDMTYEAIARRTNRPLGLIRSTIAELEAPDPQSRTPDADGARLKRLDAHRDGGGGIINFDRFNKLVNEEQRRGKTRTRVAKHRRKIRGKHECNANVTLRNDAKRKKRHTDTDVDTDTDTDTKKKQPLPFDEFWAAWPKSTRKKSKSVCRDKWDKDKLDEKADHIIAVVEALKESYDWTKEGGQYIKAPLAWLNKKFWDCDLQDIKDANRQATKTNSGQLPTPSSDYGNPDEQLNL